MLIALDSNNGRIEARQAVKQDGPFHCPECCGDVVLKKGLVVIHHFAHTPDSNCTYGAGETRAHMGAKYGVYDLLKANPNISKVEIEWRLADGCRADVYTEIGWTKLAIELQHSQQDARETIRRTKRYNELGVAVMWVAVPDIKKLAHVDLEYRATEMEKVFQRFHLGTYFLWRADTKTLHKAHLSSVPRYVDGGEFGSSYTTWYKDRNHLNLSDPLGSTGWSVQIERVKAWKVYPERMIAVARKEAK